MAEQLADQNTDMSIEAHHARFRVINKETVEYCESEYREDAVRDWVVQAYNSKEELERMFPDPQVREQMLQRLEQSRNEVRKILDELWPLEEVSQ